MLDVEALIQVLNEQGVAYVIIGGIAAVLHGSAYVTADFDICYDRRQENLQRLADALEPLTPSLRGAPADRPFLWDAETLRRGLNFTLVTTLGDLDLIGEVSGLGGYDEVLGSADMMELDGRRIHVLSLEGLIRAKEAAGRQKDRLLLPELRALLRLRDKGEDGPDEVV